MVKLFIETGDRMKRFISLIMATVSISAMADVQHSNVCRIQIFNGDSILMYDTHEQDVPNDKRLDIVIPKEYFDGRCRISLIDGDTALLECSTSDNKIRFMTFSDTPVGTHNRLQVNLLYAEQKSMKMSINAYCIPQLQSKI